MHDLLDEGLSSKGNVKKSLGGGSDDNIGILGQHGSLDLLGNVLRTVYDTDGLAAEGGELLAHLLDLLGKLLGRDEDEGAGSIFVGRGLR